MRRVGRWIILRRYLDDIAADDVEPLQTAQYLLGFAWGDAPHFRSASAWSIGRVKSVHVKGHIHWPGTDHGARLLDHSIDAHTHEVFDMHHGHASVIGKFPQEF